jgi:hypothetical protein
MTLFGDGSRFNGPPRQRAIASRTSGVGPWSYFAPAGPVRRFAPGGTGLVSPITGHGDGDIRTQAIESGAIDVLFKPFDEAILVEAIERALDQS